jgi:TetR/AcrR family transcriptional regulator, mexJK operon transcriptional repressor
MTTGEYERTMSNPPLEPGEFKRGPGGRPTREEAERRHRSLLATAFRLFLHKGWDGVSIEEISRASGVAKGFIYARYADKGTLFTEAIERLMADVMGTLHLAEPLPDDVEQGLVSLGRRMLDVALQPEALAFYRQFIAEAGRLQELAQHFVEHNPLLALLTEVLRTYAERGDITVTDPRLTAEHFAILVVGVPRMRALFVGREPPAEEERRLRAAVQLFLDGCRKDK